MRRRAQTGGLVRWEASLLLPSGFPITQDNYAVTFLSDIFTFSQVHANPDMAIEAFVLEPADG